MNEIEKKLFNSIKNLFKEKSLKDLKFASLNLSKKYRSQRHKFFSSDEQRLSYIATRMMATFKTIEYVLNEIKKICPKIKIKSVLDLGSGSGSSFWAILSYFNSFLDQSDYQSVIDQYSIDQSKIDQLITDRLKKAHLVERDEKMLIFAKTILSQLNEKILNKIVFEKSNILKIKNYDFDIVILSYVANEIQNFQIEKIINRWSLSKSKIFIAIEPGTKYGFKKIRFIRKKLIEKGFDIIAPCPNKKKCPMSKEDWCHFYTRVKRSKIHKYLKGAKLGYEDEKFSYVVATKQKVKYPFSRVLRFPSKRKNEIVLTLCKDGTIIKEKILKNNSKKYKIAKKIDWGDVLDEF